VSWFWSVGAVLTSLFVPLVKGNLGGSETVATLFLSIFSVGIAVGSILVARLLKGAVSVRYAPVAALIITLFIGELYFAIGAWSAAADRVIGVADLLVTLQGWRIVTDLFGMSIAAGVFIVPLYTLLQTASAPAARSRTIAANNIINAGFMAIAALASSMLLGAGLGVPEILLIVGAINLLVIIPCLRVHRLESSVVTTHSS
jgi:hypothetical protein